MGVVEWIGVISGVVGIIGFVWFLREKLPPKRLSWRLAENSAERIVDKMAADCFDPTLIFGIGRGGAIFGSLISGSSGHCPLVVIDRKYHWSDKGRCDELILPIKLPEDYLKNVLLVAGEAHSGSTMRLYYEYLSNLGAGCVKRAVLFYEEGCPTKVEYCGIESDQKGTLMPWMFTKRYARSDRVPCDTQKPEFDLRLILIRHGETSAGDDIFAGTNDYDLTVKGTEQAADLGASFCGKNVAAIFSSPLGRAVKTATMIRTFLPNARFVIEQDLREMAFGVWEGLARRDIEERFQKSYRRWKRDPVSAVPEAGENAEEVLSRLKRFLQRLEGSYKTAKGTEVVAVMHKNTIRILLSHCNNEPLSRYRDRDIGNCKPFSVEWSNGRWYLPQSQG